MALRFSLSKSLGRFWSACIGFVGRLDKRYLWLKYLLVLVFALLSLFWGEYTLVDLVDLQSRKQYLDNEIEHLEPQLREDSLKLEAVKHLGSGTEAIARERYLMKAPGEQIFLIVADSAKN